MRKFKWLALAALAAFMVSGCMQPEQGKTEPDAPASESKPATDSPAPKQTPEPEQPDSESEEVPVPESGRSAPNETPPSRPASAEPATAIAAAKISDLAYKYGFMALNLPKEYSAALKAEGGCKVQEEYAKAIEGADVAASVLAYCEYLASKGEIVEDCEGAIANAEQLAADNAIQANLCAQANGDVMLSKSLVLTSLAYRVSLGLPLPKRASAK